MTQMTSGMDAKKRMSSARPALFSNVEVSSNSSMSEDILLFFTVLSTNFSGAGRKSNYGYKNKVPVFVRTGCLP